MHTATKATLGWLITVSLALGLAVGSGCGDDDADNCGDGVLDETAGEQCDDGNNIDGDGCSADCLSEAYCGNNVVEIGEECDDGNDRGGDGCTSTCQREEGCGNGRLDYGEQCDDDNIASGDGCSETCVDEDGTATCGNAILEAGEDCDDGNLAPGDNCDALCQVESGCGNGTIDPGEECDDDNTVSGDGCSHNCVLEYVCGDGICDAANVETCVKCPADCCPFCGDGVLDIWSEGEQDPPPYEDEGCDDGNNVDGDGCNSGCVDEDGIPTCGNAILETGEECDDGNTENGDACSSTCTWEFQCGDQFCDVGNGETCRLCMEDCCPDCGDGTLGPGESCDGNALSGLTCEDFCYDGGTLACAPWCDFDLSGCTGTGPICGNSTAECSEDCDAADLRGHDCDSLGRDGGVLSCNTDCTWNFDQCGDLLVYFQEDFENPATVAAWTLGGDWQSGMPSAANEPPAAHGGLNVIGTIMGGTYTGNNTYTADRAETPPIDLTGAFAPVLRFYMWVYTEASWDCGNLWIDSGTGFQHTTASVAYNGNEGGYACWEGTSTLVWQEVTKDLSAYVGQTIRIGFGFYSDSSFHYEGWYIDDVVIAEPNALP